MRFTNGFVVLHRKVEESWIGKDAITLGLWCKLLMWANYREGSKILFQGKVIALKPGQVLTSVIQLAEALSVHRSSIERRVGLLASDGAIEKQTSNRGMIITICKYNEYQTKQNYTEEHIEEPARSQRGASEELARNKATLIEQGNKETKNKEQINLVVSEPENRPAPRQLIALWNEHAHAKLPRVNTLTFKPETTRYKKAKNLLIDNPDLDYWKAVILRISTSPFCLGDIEGSNWRANIDFLLGKESHIKVMEGKYDPKVSSNPWDLESTPNGKDNLTW